MAAGIWNIYGNAKWNVSKSLIDLSTNTFVLILVTGTYTPVVNTDALYSAVSANELTTTGGYTVGGKVLTPTDTLSAGVVTFDTTDPLWTALTATFRYGVIVRRAGGSLVAGDLLVCYSDLGGGSNITLSGLDFAVTMNVAGVFTIT